MASSLCGSCLLLFVTLKTQVFKTSLVILYLLGKIYIYSKILIKSAAFDRQHFSLFLGYSPLRVARSGAY